jgi:hypothetical protein
METIQIECPEGKKIVKTVTDNGVIITFEDINPNEVIDNKIKELEKQIEELKEQKQLTPSERFVLKTISGAKAKQPDVCGNVMWYKDGVGLFTQVFNSGELQVSYTNITYRLRSRHGLNNGEIEQLLTNLLCDYTNNGQLKIKF